MKTLVKSLFVKTPGIESFPNYYIVQRLIEERIRSVLMGEPFHDHSKDLVRKFMTIPPHYQTVEAVEKFVDSEAKALMAAFHNFEQMPDYQEDIKLLRQCEGSTFRIVSTTLSGITVLIDAEA